MTVAQRVVFVLLLCIAAICLHVICFEWTYAYDAPIIVDYVFIHLYPDNGLSVLSAELLGALTPVLLIGASVMLILPSRKNRKNSDAVK